MMDAFALALLRHIHARLDCQNCVFIYQSNGRAVSLVKDNLLFISLQEKKSSKAKLDPCYIGPIDLFFLLCQIVSWGGGTGI